MAITTFGGLLDVDACSASSAGPSLSLDVEHCCALLVHQFEKESSPSPSCAGSIFGASCRAALNNAEEDPPAKDRGVLIRTGLKTKAARTSSDPSLMGNYVTSHPVCWRVLSCTRHNYHHLLTSEYIQNSARALLAMGLLYQACLPAAHRRARVKPRLNSRLPGQMRKERPMLNSAAEQLTLQGAHCGINANWRAQAPARATAGVAFLLHPCCGHYRTHRSTPELCRLWDCCIEL